MRKQVLTFGMFALVALMPIGNVIAGGNDPCTITSPVNIASRQGGTMYVKVVGTYTQNQIQIQPVNGFSVKSVTYTDGSINIALTNLNPQSIQNRTNKQDGLIDVITIIGVDNITGVLVDDGGNSSGAGGYYRSMSLDNNNPVEPLQDPDNSGKQTGSDEVNPNDQNPNDLGSTLTPNGSSTGKKDNGFTVFPNPVGDEANIITVGEILAKTIDVVDLSGRVHQVMRIQATGRFSINLSGLTPGIYMLIMKTEDGKTFVQKISKL